MKSIRVFLMMSVLAILTVSCQNKVQPEEKESVAVVQSQAETEVYYFHFTRRCATCNAVEDVTKDALKEFYPNLIDEDKIAFHSLDLEEPQNAAVAEELGVSAQALIFVHGDQKLDLTQDGFLYARVSPSKLKEKIKEAVDQLIAE